MHAFVSVHRFDRSLSTLGEWKATAYARWLGNDRIAGHKQNIIVLEQQQKHIFIVRKATNYYYFVVIGFTRCLVY